MHSLTLPQPKLERTTILRVVGFGTAWGVAVAGALLGLSLYQDGSICLGQIVETTTLAIASGTLTIGPLAALRRGHSADGR